MKLSETDLEQISGGISAKKVLLIGGLALLGISTATVGAYFAYKHGLFGSKTHPNANPLELGDDIWDEAEKQGNEITTKQNAKSLRRHDFFADPAHKKYGRK